MSAKLSCQEQKQKQRYLVEGPMSLTFFDITLLIAEYIGLGTNFIKLPYFQRSILHLLDFHPEISQDSCMPLVLSLI